MSTFKWNLTPKQWLFVFGYAGRTNRDDIGQCFFRVFRVHTPGQ